MASLQSAPAIFSTTQLQFNFYSAMALLFAIGVIYLNRFLPQEPALIYIHTSFLLIAIINYVWHNINKKYTNGLQVILGLGAITVISHYYFSSFDGTGFIWTYAGLTFAGLLGNRFMLYLWSGTIIVSELIITAAWYLTPLPQPYSNPIIIAHGALVALLITPLLLFQQRMQDFHRLKVRFLDSVAHELGRPLTAAQIQLQLAQHAVVNKHSPEAHISATANSLNRLQATIKKLLDIVQLDSRDAPVNISRINITQIAREQIALFSNLFQQANIFLRLDDSNGDIYGYGDNHYCQLIISEFLQNALQHSESSSHVILSVSHNRKRVIVSVRDNGIGFEPQHANYIFTQFASIHKMQTGLGVSLYYCKQLVERMRGHIGANSSGVGTGALFWFSLLKSD